MGERKFIQMVLVTWPRWPPCPYMVKILKILLLNQKADDLEAWYAALGAWVLPSCSNDDTGLTLTYFMARSNLVPYAFVWEKGKTMDFSEIIVVCDLKLATDDQMTRSFCWHQNFVSWGLYIHVIFSWTQIGRFGFTDREIGSQIGRFFRGKIYSILVWKKLLFAAPWITVKCFICQRIVKWR